MSDTPVPFLQALGQALSAHGLYAKGHPARDRAIAAASEALGPLLEDREAASFSFLGGEVVFDRRLLKEVKAWEWADRLAGYGMERVEFVGPVPPEALVEFIEVVHLRGGGESGPETSRAAEAGAGGSGAGAVRGGSIRWGRVTLEGQELEELSRQVTLVPVAYDLREEVAAVQWVQEQAQESADVPLTEVTTVVRSLALAMRQEGRLVLPLLELMRFDQFAVTHSCNVSVLAMGVAEHVGLAPREVRSVGVAGLLHDLGKTKLRRELVQKEGRYTEADRREMERHPAEGAKLLLGRHRHLDLAAVVAYEHHLRLDGSGYPVLTYPREPHFISRLVAVCEVYDALSTRVPFQERFTPEAALAKIEAGSGRGFDPTVVGALATMLRSARQQRVPVAEPVVMVDGEQPPPG